MHICVVSRYAQLSLIFANYAHRQKNTISHNEISAKQINREMLKRIIHLLVISLLVLVPTIASTPVHKDGKKQMKTIREQIKNRKGADALKAVENLRKDSSFAWNAQLLQYGVEACKILNDKENEKFYLNANPDTVAFFNTTYNVIQYILLTDSAERNAVLQSDTLKSEIIFAEPSKYKYRKTNKETLLHIYKNFLTAPRYFSSHSNWSEVQRFSGMAIDMAQSSIAKSFRAPLVPDKTINELAVLNVNSCYRQQKYDDIERYAAYAVQDSANAESVIEKLAYCEYERGDSLAYCLRLEKGHSLYPDNMFFFSRLVDVNLRSGHNDVVLSTANETLEYVLHKAQDEAMMCIIDASGQYAQPSDAQALVGVKESVSLPATDIAEVFEAKAVSYHNVGNDRACIEEAENILRWNPEHPRADFYIGASYYTMAENIDIPASVNAPNYTSATRERNRLLTLARPHLEAYRVIAPNESGTWAPLLYEVYLYLNLGPEFEEISKYIH